MAALAQLDLHHSRPIAPTRRVALGLAVLPTDPAPGPGGVLLGGIAASYASDLPEDIYEGIHVLTLQLQEGQRIVQPRLRHRFQTDRIGLTRSQFRLVNTPDGLVFDFETLASPLQAVLGACYAAGRLDGPARRSVMDAIRKGMRWGGGVDRSLVAHLSGLDAGKEWGADMYEDPVSWALQILGLEAKHNGDRHLPDRKAIQRRFRDCLRDAHPDHNDGDEVGAAERIAELTEARKILLA